MICINNLWSGIIILLNSFPKALIIQNLLSASILKYCSLFSNHFIYSKKNYKMETYELHKKVTTFPLSVPVLQYGRQETMKVHGEMTERPQQVQSSV